jgi:hypothetical protein
MHFNANFIGLKVMVPPDALLKEVGVADLSLFQGQFPPN